MRSTVEGVDTSYDMVTDRMAAAPAARFEVPGDLGPGYQPHPPSATTPAAPVSAQPVVANFVVHVRSYLLPDHLVGTRPIAHPGRDRGGSGQPRRPLRPRVIVDGDGGRDL
jgi:hypothetical protein